MPIGEASVIIAAASPHRRDALESVHHAIDVLKERVPSWKREVYSDGTVSWKENCECAHGQARREQPGTQLEGPEGAAGSTDVPPGGSSVHVEPFRGRHDHENPT